ncbi:MAG: hypothetical protein F4X25_02845 [Chloroflexi bacterium]|nr:hypothetical protein [Chloroflexota bacterium]
MRRKRRRLERAGASAGGGLACGGGGGAGTGGGTGGIATVPACAPGGAPSGSNPGGGAWKPSAWTLPRITSRQRLQKNCSTGSSQSPTQTSPQSMPGMSLRGLR